MVDAFCDFWQLGIVVEGDDVGFFQLLVFRGRELFDIAPVADPDAGGERLRRVHFASPDESFLQQLKRGFFFVRQFDFAILRDRVIGFVEDVPDLHAAVVAEMADDILHIGFELVLEFSAGENVCAGALDPTGVVCVRTRFALFARLRERVPNAVKNNEHDADIVFVGHAEELIHAIDESFWILFPGEVMQENANAGEAEALCKTEFAIDGFRVPCFSLPHLELVDGSAWGEVAPDEQGLVGIPAVRFGLSPFGPGLERLLRTGAAAEQESDGDEL